MKPFDAKHLSGKHKVLVGGIALFAALPLGAETNCNQSRHVSQVFGQSSSVPQACHQYSTVGTLEPSIQVSDVQGRSSLALPRAAAVAPIAGDARSPNVANALGRASNWYGQGKTTDQGMVAHREHE
jgi:hypothetical protein